MENGILVPLDGSPASEPAVAVAIAIANTIGGTVELAHVHDIPRFLSGTAPQDIALDRDEAEHMREPLAALAQRPSSGVSPIGSCAKAPRRCCWCVRVADPPRPHRTGRPPASLFRWMGRHWAKRSCPPFRLRTYRSIQ